MQCKLLVNTYGLPLPYQLGRCWGKFFHLSKKKDNHGSDVTVLVVLQLWCLVQKINHLVAISCRSS